MANKHGKEVDTTSLSLDQAANRGFIHRDYLAHCLRWSHVCRYLHEKKRYQTHHVLDVGCGKEAPLPKLLFSSRLTHTTGSYTGLDYGKIEWPASIPQGSPKFKAQFLEKADFVKVTLPRKAFDTVVCFEVMEHVEPYHTYEMLCRIRGVLASGGVAFVSTPCYDKAVGAADNHVNEMTYHGFKALIELAALKVDEVYGTFASQKDYKKLMAPAEREVFDKLSKYYDSNVVSCMFAPLYAEQSRNCIWKLSQGKVVAPNPKDPVDVFAASNSSSTKWQTDLKKAIAASKKGTPF